MWVQERPSWDLMLLLWAEAAYEAVSVLITCLSSVVDCVKVKAVKFSVEYFCPVPEINSRGKALVFLLHKCYGFQNSFFFFFFLSDVDSPRDWQQMTGELPIGWHWHGAIYDNTFPYVAYFSTKLAPESLHPLINKALCNRNIKNCIFSPKAL